MSCLITKSANNHIKATAAGRLICYTSYYWHMINGDSLDELRFVERQMTNEEVFGELQTTNSLLKRYIRVTGCSHNKKGKIKNLGVSEKCGTSKHRMKRDTV
jgi:hypothetical protein